MGSLAVSSHLPLIQNVCAAPAAIHTHRDLTTGTPLAVTDRPPIGFSAGGKSDSINDDPSHGSRTVAAANLPERHCLQGVSERARGLLPFEEIRAE